MITGQTNLGSFTIDVIANGNDKYKATISHNGSYKCSIKNATIDELGIALTEEISKIEKQKEIWYERER